MKKEEGVEKSLDRLEEEEYEEEEENEEGEEKEMEKTEKDGSDTEADCLRAYQISLTYANTPGR